MTVTTHPLVFSVACFSYREWDLNPHSHFWPKDFKSFVSTDSTIAACDHTSDRRMKQPPYRKALQRYNKNLEYANLFVFWRKMTDLSSKPALCAACRMLAYIKVAHNVGYDGEAVFPPKHNGLRILIKMRLYFRGNAAQRQAASEVQQKLSAVAHIE